MPAHHLIAVCGILPWAAQTLTDISGLLHLSVAVGAAVVVLAVVIFKRTIIGLVVALLFAGIAYWAVAGSGIVWTAQQVGGQTGSGVVHQVTAPASGGACPAS